MPVNITMEFVQQLMEHNTALLEQNAVQIRMGMVHEIYSVENQTNYSAKIRIRDTVIYVFALSQYRDDVAELLDTIGYWKE